MATATPEDVRIELETDLDDLEIQAVLDTVEADIELAYGDTDISFTDSTHRRRFEATLTALRIAGGRTENLSSVSHGQASISYASDDSSNTYSALRGRVNALDPGEAFSHVGVTRDTDRHFRTTSHSS